MSENTITIQGSKYITHPSLSSGGDHGDTVNISNIAYLKENFPYKIMSFRSLYSQEVSPGKIDASESDECALIIGYDDFGGEVAYLKEDNPELTEILEGLTDYPVICDEKLSEVENKLYEDEWGKNTKDELTKILCDNSDENEEIIELMSEASEEELDTLLYDHYQAVMEKTNTYPEMFDGNVSLDIENMKDAFIAEFEQSTLDVILKNDLGEVFKSWTTHEEERASISPASSASMLLSAISNNALKITEYLLKTGAPCQPQLDGDSPIIQAKKLKEPEMIALVESFELNNTAKSRATNKITMSVDLGL